MFVGCFECQCGVNVKQKEAPSPLLVSNSCFCNLFSLELGHVLVLAHCSLTTVFFTWFWGVWWLLAVTSVMSVDSRQLTEASFVLPGVTPLTSRSGVHIFLGKTQKNMPHRFLRDAANGLFYCSNCTAQHCPGVSLFCPMDPQDLGTLVGAKGPMPPKWPWMTSSSPCLGLLCWPALLKVNQVSHL